MERAPRTKAPAIYAPSAAPSLHQHSLAVSVHADSRVGLRKRAALCIRACDVIEQLPFRSVLSVILSRSAGRSGLSIFVVIQRMDDVICMRKNGMAEARMMITLKRWNRSFCQWCSSAR